MRIIVLLFSLWTLAAAAEQRVIELSDGSRIRGEIVSKQGDTWTIRTDALGEVRVDSARIRSIGMSASAPAGSAESGSLGAIKSSIANDAGLMARIMSLQNDPQVRAILSDPEIMSAVRSLDFEALRNNPKFRSLMENEEMQSITSSISQ